MIKALIVLLISGYSLARVTIIAYQLYMEILILPLWVVGVAAFCSLWALAAGLLALFGRLGDRGLVRAVMLVALGSLCNVTGLVWNPVNNLTVYDLMITGTLFDVVFFGGVCAVPLGQKAPSRGRSRARRAEDSADSLAPGGAPLEEGAGAVLHTSQ